METDDTPIYVTKSFLPPREEFDRYVDTIWQNGKLTNNGPLLQEFEKKVAEYLDVEYFQFVANGTLALQLAIDGLGITEGEIITTPFSYVATTSAILWQRCTPVFVDIDENTLNINPEKIEEAITPNTKAILAVHVFGNACDVDAIQRVADKHNLKVIYDGAHAFGAKYQEKSLLDNGDISVVSFHATKLFNTIEGGGIISKSKEIHDIIDLKKRFGHHGESHQVLGINAKANEFQAAMGLAGIQYIDEIVDERKLIAKEYDSRLKKVLYQKTAEGLKSNYAYYPVILSSESVLLRTMNELANINIYARRYFYPSLNTLPYVNTKSICPVSEDIANRVLCLPLYVGLEMNIVEKICRVINDQ